MTKYIVTREFIGGVSKGQTHTGVTNVKFEVGFVCRKPSGGSPYKVIAVRRTHSDFLTVINGVDFEMVLNPATGGSMLRPIAA